MPLFRPLEFQRLSPADQLVWLDAELAFLQTNPQPDRYYLDLLKLRTNGADGGGKRPDPAVDAAFDRIDAALGRKRFTSEPVG
jgi:hypothetical protein